MPHGARRVLCFDDNALHTEALGMRLGFEPDILWLPPRHTLNDAAGAVDTAKADVVLLDLRMPGDISPLALIRQLRERQTSLRIIVLTGAPGSDAAREAAAAGADAVLGKDVLPEVLIAAIRAAPG